MKLLDAKLVIDLDLLDLSVKEASYLEVYGFGEFEIQHEDIWVNWRWVDAP